MAADHCEDADSEQDERELEEKRRKDAEYLDFRRKIDQMKTKQKGLQSDAEKMKQQGNHFFSIGCYSQAAIMYCEALELDPHNHVLYCNRSMAYLKQDMPDEALEDAETSLSLCSGDDNIKAYWRKAQALLDLGRSVESEAASDEGLALKPTNPHLNRVRRLARETTAMHRLCSGEWAGQLDNGIEQRLSFCKDGAMVMNVFGHKVQATFDLSVEGNPRSMVVRMKSDGMGPENGPPPPPVPYIFEFRSADELWLCHPVGSQELPTSFQGPGFMRMRKTIHVAEEISAEPLDVRCARYMEEMNKLLPLLPIQLPEQPSDEQVKQEVALIDSMSALKRREGMDAHRRAVELAREPEKTASDDLRDLAQDFRCRLQARKLLPKEDLVSAEEAIEEQPSAESAAGTETKLRKGFLEQAREPLYGPQGSVEGQVASETLRAHTEREQDNDPAPDTQEDPLLDQLMEMKVGSENLALSRKEAARALRQAHGDLRTAAGLLLRGVARKEEDLTSGSAQATQPDATETEATEVEVTEADATPLPAQDTAPVLDEEPALMELKPYRGVVEAGVPDSSSIKQAPLEEQEPQAKLPSKRPVETCASKKYNSKPGCLSNIIQSICGGDGNKATFAP